ncbi:uncharacterized protein [Coffea arabica]|uniref:DNA helicase Pif1-like 2B domain-containing protein n=1 Tax=Coffea arabica TaxID=13443 RepID=A0ABM4UYJ1_COFAR
MQRPYPSVIRLQYHLPDHQFVIFNDDNHLYDVLDRDHIHDTMLTKWFERNQSDVSARNLMFAEFPSKWTWNQNKRQWESRLQGRCIGRLPYAHPHSSERYYLRMLLHKIRGARSFEHLRTIDGVVHPTFKATCVALGLLDDDNEWNETFAETSTWASAKKLRSMYCTILMHSEITNPSDIWQRHWKSITDDLQYQIRRDIGNSQIRIDDDKLIREEFDYDFTSEQQLFDNLYAGDIVENMNPPEMLHSLNFPGLPNHFLELKERTPIILLRNLNQSEGLCNGTRLVVTIMGDKVLEAEVITGSKIGDLVLIPRISLTPQSA